MATQKRTTQTNQMDRKATKLVTGWEVRNVSKFPKLYGEYAAFYNGVAVRNMNGFTTESAAWTHINERYEK